MLDAPDTDDPVEREMVKQVDDIDGLLLGALLHDIGKIGEGSHVPIGTAIATETLARMGIEATGRATSRSSWSSTTWCCPTPRRAATSPTRT